MFINNLQENIILYLIMITVQAFSNSNDRNLRDKVIYVYGSIFIKIWKSKGYEHLYLQKQLHKARQCAYSQLEVQGCMALGDH